MSKLTNSQLTNLVDAFLLLPLETLYSLLDEMDREPEGDLHQRNALSYAYMDKLPEPDIDAMVEEQQRRLLGFQEAEWIYYNE